MKKYFRTPAHVGYMRQVLGDKVDRLVAQVRPSTADAITEGAWADIPRGTIPGNRQRWAKRRDVGRIRARKAKCALRYEIESTSEE